MRFATKFGAEGPLVTVGRRLKCPWFEDLTGFSRKKHDRVLIALLALPY